MKNEIANENVQVFKKKRAFKKTKRNLLIPSNVVALLASVLLGV